MIEIASKALWITFSAYLVYVIGKWIYSKYIKQDVESYFYFLSLNMDEQGIWFLRIDAPKNDFDIEIGVMMNDKIVYKKNACLKAGINRILIPIDLLDNKDLILKIESEKQKIERPFVESQI